MVQMDHGPHPILLLMNENFFFPFSQTNECIYSQRKREKIYINTAAIFVRKFYIRKILVFLVLFWKKRTKIITNFTTKIFTNWYGDMIVLA